MGKFIKSTRVKRRHWRCAITKSELPNRKLILKFNYKCEYVFESVFVLQILHSRCHIHKARPETMSKVSSCIWINNANSNFHRISRIFCFVYYTTRISFISNSIHSRPLCLFCFPFHHRPHFMSFIPFQNIHIL